MQTDQEQPKVEEKATMAKQQKTEIEQQAAEEVIDMVWFGGIGHNLTTEVFHVRLILNYENSS